ncbi:MAG: 4-hydroxy-tetrahydrodipicolinate synthase [DPANN group archaeon]|nr:4-hydroxy-tetrahydrodipicolinate synthase [DPANN group archaeon]
MTNLNPIDYRGHHVAITTPLEYGGSIDENGLKQNIEFLLEYGVNGIVAVGTTGQSPTLTPDEHLKVIAITVDTVNGKIPVIAGTGSNNTKEAIYFTRESNNIGADATLQVDPYYNKPNSNGIARHIDQIAKSADIPIIYYSIPGRSGTTINVADLAQLTEEYSQIIGIKNATSDFENMKNIRKYCGNDFLILSGNDTDTQRMMWHPDIKADGVVSVMGNLTPQISTEIIKNSLDLPRNTSKKDIYDKDNKLLPLYNLEMGTDKKNSLSHIKKVILKYKTNLDSLQKYPNPVGIHTMMDILGMPTGELRSPLEPVPDVLRQKVKNVLSKFQKETGYLDPVSEFFDINLETKLNL